MKLPQELHRHLVQVLQEPPGLPLARAALQQLPAQQAAAALGLRLLDPRIRQNGIGPLPAAGSGVLTRRPALEGRDAQLQVQRAVGAVEEEAGERGHGLVPRELRADVHQSKRCGC